ncbi:MAG: hypothetical protein AAFY88_07885 [Acidobacteriota bacterium]
MGCHHQGRRSDEHHGIKCGSMIGDIEEILQALNQAEDWADVEALEELRRLHGGPL